MSYVDLVAPQERRIVECMELPMRTILTQVARASRSPVEALRETRMNGGIFLSSHHGVGEAALEEVVIFGCQLLHDICQTQSFSLCQVSHPSSK